MMDLASAKLRLAALFEQPPKFVMEEVGSKVAIYGAGSCGRDVLRVLRDAGYEVVAFLDTNAVKIGDVDGIPCHQPGDAESRALAVSGTAVLVAVFNFTADTGEIEDVLHRNGFENVLPYYALDAKFPGKLKSRFWMATRDFWNQHKACINRGLELWSDGESRKLYLELVELRLTLNLQLLRCPDRSHQYFPTNLPPLREPIRLIDGGAYVGDTLAAIQQFQLEAVAAFEPDLENFRNLRRWLEKEGAGINEAVLFPCGLDRESAMRRFNTGQAAGSAVTKFGDSTIQVVALDDVLPRFAPTFIKLDIEGAEIDALNGAREMIRKHQPRIAACVYHLPEHLWEVPLLLKELVPEHRLHLRYHGFNGFDAVAYAIEPA